MQTSVDFVVGAEGHLARFGAYLREVKMLSPSTRRRYLAVAEEFWRFLAEEAVDPETALPGVNKDTLLRFLRQGGAGDGEPSRSRWNNRLSGLRAFYGFLNASELVRRNPTHAVERLRLPPRERLPLSLADALTLISAAWDGSPPRLASRNVALLQVLLHCGLRVAEVAALQLDQVDLEGRMFLSVRTKGGQNLAVLFNDVVAEALEQYLADRREWGVPEAERALFLSTRGRRLSVRAIEYLVKGLAAKAGIKRPVTPHVLRHSTATLLVELTDAPLPVIQDHLGHRDVATTRRYIHTGLRQRRRALEQLGKAWKRAAQRRERRGQRAGVPISSEPAIA